MFMNIYTISYAKRNKLPQAPRTRSHALYKHSFFVINMYKYTRRLYEYYWRIYT
jgi:hypothetical protein